MEKQFPNGFTSWMETHHEVVEHLTLLAYVENSKVWKRIEEQGRGGLYELAEELTDKFEAENKGKEWDGDYYEAIQDFLNDFERADMEISVILK